MTHFRLIALILLLFPGQTWSESSESGEQKILKATVDGRIGPATVYYLKHVFEKSKEGDNKAVLLSINTPGGFLESTREIVNLINASEKPVITYVTPAGGRATSAGAFILLAGHLALMDEGTNVGAASPVKSDGRDLGDTMKKKVLNDTQAFIRSVAEKRDRNVEVSEKFVSKALSLTAKEAMENDVIDSLVREGSSLTKTLAQSPLDFSGTEIQFDEKNVVIKSINKRTVDQFLSFISKPQIAYLLTSLGTIGIYIELVAFGAFIPGILGVISLILGLIAMTTLPVNAGFMALLVFGVCLLTIELTISGFGLVGLCGLISFFFGSLYLFEEPVQGNYYNIVYGVSAGFVLFFFTIIFALSKRNKELDSLVNTTGVCQTDFIGDAGYISINGKNYKALSRDERELREGHKIQVVRVEKNYLIVKVIDE